jgi:hypothetical protein
VGAAVFAATVRDRIPSVIAAVCAAALLAGAAWVATQQLAQPAGLYDNIPALVGDLAGAADVGDALAVIQRNPHSGVAYAVAQTTDDAAWSEEIVDRLVGSAQPTVEVRSISGTGPLESQSLWAARPGEGGTVWIVSLDAPSDTELAAIDEALECTSDASSLDPAFYGGIRLYALPCG